MAELPENPGSQIPPDHTGASAPPFQPVAPQYQQVVPPIPGAPPPPPPPAKSGGGGVLKIILIILGIMAFLVLLVVCMLAYACHKVKQSFHTDSKTGETSLSIPGMSVNADSGKKFTSSELGVDIYPGADPSKSGNLRMNIAGSSVVSATFTTSDSKDKVVDFYKDKLGSNSTSMDFGESAILTEKKSDQDQVSITISQKSNEDEGKTKFVIQHTTVKKAN